MSLIDLLYAIFDELLADPGIGKSHAAEKVEALFRETEDRCAALTAENARLKGNIERQSASIRSLCMEMGDPLALKRPTIHAPVAASTIAALTADLARVTAERDGTAARMAKVEMLMDTLDEMEDLDEITANVLLDLHAACAPPASGEEDCK
jgi:uncharacterized small protein (DUF1192 family)